MKRVLLTVAMFATLLVGSAMTPTNAEARPPAYRGGVYGGYYGGNFGPRYYGNTYYRPYYTPYAYPRAYRYPTYYGRSYYGYPRYNAYPNYRYGYRGGAYYY